MSTDSNDNEVEKKAADGTPKDEADDGTPKDEADDRIAAVQAPTTPSAAIDGPKEEEAEEDAAPKEEDAEEDAAVVAQEQPSPPGESGADASFPEQLWDLVEAESRDGINNAERQRVIEWTENGEGVSPTGM